MTENIGTIQGTKVSIAVETALGTPGSYTDIHYNGEDTEFPTATRDAYMQPGGGRTNPADYPLAIPYETYKEDALTLGIMPRRHTGTGNPPMVTLLESGGWSTAKLTAAGATVVTNTTDGAIEWDNDDGCETGSMALIEVTSGYYVPVLIADWTVGTKIGIPSIDMAANPGGSAVIQQMFCCTPRTGQVTSTKTVAMKYLSRVEDGSSNPQEWIYTGGSASLGEFTITPNEPVKLPFTLHVADTDVADGTWSVETFIDQEQLNITSSDFEFRMVSGTEATIAAGALTRDTTQLISATINPGVKTKVIKGVGEDSNVNGANGYLAAFETQPTATVTCIFDVAQWEQFEALEDDSSETHYCLEFAWPTRDLDVPAMLVAMPSCQLLESPTADFKNEELGFVTCTMKFGGRAVGLDGEDGPTSAADQAIYIGISGEES